MASNRKFSKEQNAEIRATVAKFNAKVKRAKAQGKRFAKNLTTTTTSNFKNRVNEMPWEDVKELLDFTNSFKPSKQKTIKLDKVEISEWEYADLKRKVGEVNEKKEAQRDRIKEKPLRIGGVPRPDLKLGNNQLDTFSELRKSKVRTSFKSAKEYQKYKASLDKYTGDIADKMKLYRQNYLQAVENVHGKNSALYKDVQSLTDEEFMTFYYTEQLKDIYFVYEMTDYKTAQNTGEGEEEVTYLKANYNTLKKTVKVYKGLK